MAKSTASAPAPSPDILGFDEPGPAGDKEEGLDLEAYLDLEESPDITRLVQNLQGEAGASAGREDGPLAAAESSRPPLGTPAPGEPGQTTATAAPTMPMVSAGFSALSASATARSARKEGALVCITQRS